MLQLLGSSASVLRGLAVVAFGAVVTVLWLPLLSELLCMIPRRRPVTPDGPRRPSVPRILFLVPAHNEELLIGACVHSLSRMVYPAAAKRVIVIVDNCTDATATLARENGAETLERFDSELPGKPRAIAWALDQVDLHQWDACVVVDADTTVAPGFAAGLAALAPLNDIVFQANFGVLNEFETWLTRLGGVLSRCRYEVTYPLKQSAGLNCPLTGNGMGFGTNLLLGSGWRSFSITEDSELYAIYTEGGVRIRHASSASLFSQEARSLGQGATQRRRWLAGRLRVIREWGVRLIRSPHIGWHQKLDAFVELGLSSPVLHLILAFGVVVAAPLLIGDAAGWWIASLAAVSLSGIAVTALAVVRRHPQPWRTLSSFFMLPAYAGWRAFVAAGTLFTLRDTTWRKTARTAPIDGPGVASAFGHRP